MSRRKSTEDGECPVYLIAFASIRAPRGEPRKCMSGRARRGTVMRSATDGFGELHGRTRVDGDDRVVAVSCAQFGDRLGPGAEDLDGVTGFGNERAAIDVRREENERSTLDLRR